MMQRHERRGYRGRAEQNIFSVSNAPVCTALYLKERSVGTVARNRAGALDFRDFSGLLTAKENRIGSRQTLLNHQLF